ncbi:MAG: Ig-like domain-containing protein, partial [Candidatus Methanomethylophilaceae archaeon]
SQLVVTFTPSNTSNKNVAWDSSNEVVATVANGVVSGLTEGTATITATSEDGGFTATCSVSVSVAPEVEKVTLQSTYMDYVENNVYNIDSCPTVGTGKLLVIPVWFLDSSTYITSETKKSNVRSDLQKAYFGTEAETGWNSVKSFYEEESKGTLTLEGTVTDWYPANQLSTYYYSETDGSDLTSMLVESATNWYFYNNPSESRSDYDRDDNGYLDGIMLIYGSPDYSALTNDESIDDGNMWAYCFWLQKTSLNSIASPGPNVFFWASYDFMYGSITASSRAGSSYASGDTSYCNVDSHTFTHEMGHVLGLDDYYDYSSQYNPAGGFSMQDYNVGGHDPYSVMASGWAKPYIPMSSATITIGDFQSTHDLILLTPSFNTYNSPFDEYMLLELYTPTGLNEFDATHQYGGGYPKGPTTPGIRLWHVDARLTRYIAGNYSTSLTSNVLAGNVLTAMSNTYYSSEAADYISPLGSSYADYNLLQLIREDSFSSYRPTENLSSSDLFKLGDTFTMGTYASQFVNSGKLNSNTNLGWSFTIDSLSSSSATITLSRI